MTRWILPALVPLSAALLFALSILMTPEEPDRQFGWIFYTLLALKPILLVFFALGIVFAALRRWRWFLACWSAPVLMALVFLPALHERNVMRVKRALPRYMAQVTEVPSLFGHRFITVDNWTAGGLTGGPELYVVYDDWKNELFAHGPEPFGNVSPDSPWQMSAACTGRSQHLYKNFYLCALGQ